MHRRARSCPICGQMFFPASLKFHLKACAKKNAAILSQMPRSIAQQLAQGKLPRVPSRSTGKSSFGELAGSGNDHGRTGMSPSASRYTKSATSSAARPAPIATSSGIRVACSCCGRKFAPDRLAKHENACRNSKQASRRRGTFKSSMQRRRGMGSATGIKTTPGSHSGAGGQSNSAGLPTTSSFWGSGSSQAATGGFRDSRPAFDLDLGEGGGLFGPPAPLSSQSRRPRARRKRYELPSVASRDRSYRSDGSGRLRTAPHSLDRGALSRAGGRRHPVASSRHGTGSALGRPMPGARTELAKSDWKYYHYEFQQAIRRAKHRPVAGEARRAGSWDRRRHAAGANAASQDRARDQQHGAARGSVESHRGAAPGPASRQIGRMGLGRKSADDSDDAMQGNVSQPRQALMSPIVPSRTRAVFGSRAASTRASTSQGHRGHTSLAQQVALDARSRSHAARGWQSGHHAIQREPHLSLRARSRQGYRSMLPDLHTPSRLPGPGTRIGTLQRPRTSGAHILTQRAVRRDDPAGSGHGYGPSNPSIARQAWGSPSPVRFKTAHRRAYMGSPMRPMTSSIGARTGFGSSMPRFGDTRAAGSRSAHSGRHAGHGGGPLPTNDTSRDNPFAFR